MSDEAVRQQPLPIPGGEVVYLKVIDDLRRRAEMGREEYGTYLTSKNGRDHLIDAYQEALDLALYLRAFLLQRAARRAARLHQEEAP